MKKYKEYYICIDQWKDHKNGHPLLKPVYEKPLFASLHITRNGTPISYNFVEDIFKASKFRYNESRSLLQQLKENTGLNNFYIRPVTNYSILEGQVE